MPQPVYIMQIAINLWNNLFSFFCGQGEERYRSLNNCHHLLEFLVISHWLLRFQVLPNRLFCLLHAPNGITGFEHFQVMLSNIWPPCACFQYFLHPQPAGIETCLLLIPFLFFPFLQNYAIKQHWIVVWNASCTFLWGGYTGKHSLRTFLGSSPPPVPHFPSIYFQGHHFPPPPTALFWKTKRTPLNW